MSLLFIILALLVAYLLGSLSGGLLLARLFGNADLRAAGSGNTGATNALRAGGKAYGAAVLVFDLLKGALAAGLVPILFFGGLNGWAFACAAAVVLGHVFPVYHGFRGGKGVATIIGVLLVLLPKALGIGVVIWIVTLVLTGFVGLASLLGMLAVALWCISTHMAVDAATAFVFAMTALVFYTHRGNIARMRSGNENRFIRVMLRKP